MSLGVSKPRGNRLNNSPKFLHQYICSKQRDSEKLLQSFQNKWCQSMRILNISKKNVLSYYVYLRLSSVSWCPLWFPHKHDVRSVFTSSCLQEGLCLAYVVCVCFRIVVSNTYCVVFLFCFCSSCVACIASFSGLSIFDCPFGILFRVFIVFVIIFKTSNLINVFKMKDRLIEYSKRRYTCNGKTKTPHQIRITN